MERSRKTRRGVLAISLALAALGAAAQGNTAGNDAGMDCRQLRAELAALAAGKQGSQPLQAVQVAHQAVPGAPGAPRGDAAQAQAQAAAVAQVAALQAQARQRAATGVGRTPAETGGAVGMLGVPVGAGQAAQPVATPGNAALQQLAGSRQDQLGGLYLAKGCQ